MTSSTLLNRLATGLLVVSLGLFGAACGDDDDEDTSFSQATTATTATGATNAPQLTTGANTINIQNFAFVGIDDARSAANQWTVVNQDSAPHTVSAVDGSFVWRVEGGQTGTFTHQLAPGSYPIRCDVHPARMTGTLVVS
ncbi:MAG: cupredoxin domain-containing protein [Acidimicrobiia bacterium]